MVGSFTLGRKHRKHFALPIWLVAVTLDNISLTFIHTMHKYHFRVKWRAGHMKPDKIVFHCQ